MRTRLIFAALLACLLPLGGTARADGALAAVAGFATSDFSECSQDGLQIGIAGQQLTADLWSFQLAMVNSEPTCVIPGIVLPFLGEWSTAGGCVPVIGLDLLLDPLYLCLMDPVVQKPPTIVEYAFEICDREPPCELRHKANLVVVEAL